MDYAQVARSNTLHKHAHAPCPVAALKIDIIRTLGAFHAEEEFGTFDASVTRRIGEIEHKMHDARKALNSVAVADVFTEHIDSTSMASLLEWSRREPNALPSPQFQDLIRAMQSPGFDFAAQNGLASTGLGLSEEEKKSVLEGLRSLSLLRLIRYGDSNSAKVYLETCIELATGGPVEGLREEVGFSELWTQLSALKAACEETFGTMDHYSEKGTLKKLMLGINSLVASLDETNRHLPSYERLDEPLNFAGRARRALRL